MALAALFWASSGTLAKVLFRSGITPPELVQVRVTLASVLLGIGFLIFARNLLTIRARDIGYFFLLGCVVMAALQLTYFYAISKIQVMAAILLQYLSPMLTAVFSIAFWGERLTVSKIGALILALGGCYLVAGGYNLELLHMNRLGILGGLASAVCYAAYSLLGERSMHRYSPWTVAFYALLFAAVTWQVILTPFGFLYESYSLFQWMCIIYIVVPGTIAPFALFFLGINQIRSTRAMITATLEPIAAGVMAFLFLGEHLAALQIAGAVLVVNAIVLLGIDREQDERTPARIRRD